MIEDCEDDDADLDELSYMKFITGLAREYRDTNEYQVKQFYAIATQLIDQNLINKTILQKLLTYSNSIQTKNNKDKIDEEKAKSMMIMHLQFLISAYALNPKDSHKIDTDNKLVNLQDIKEITFDQLEFDRLP